MRIGFAIGRAVVATAIVAAIVGQLNTSLAFWPANGVTNIALSITNFFSFFTIQSNVATVAVTGIGAYLLATNRRPKPQWFNTLFAAVATYMIVTGIVYNLLLRGIELPQGSTLGWSNEILHVVGPLWMLIDWLFAPGRVSVPWKKLWLILIFPIVWAVYTLVRGPLTPNEVTGQPYWYPYPFLNPNLSENGYLSVAFYVILIAAIIGGVAAGVIWWSRRGERQRAQGVAATAPLR